MRNDEAPRDPRTEWQNQPTEDFHMSRPLLDRYVSTSHRRLQRLTVAQYAGSIGGLVFGIWVAATLDGRMMRIGAVLIALMFAFVLVLLYRAQGARNDGPAIALPSIESYRADLERHRTLFSGYRLWSRVVIGVPVATVFCLGFAQAYPALARFIYLELVATVAGISISCLIAHRKARQYQQEIDELDALRR
jgi:hypothetical protein